MSTPCRCVRVNVDGSAGPRLERRKHSAFSFCRRERRRGHRAGSGRVVGNVKQCAASTPSDTGNSHVVHERTHTVNIDIDIETGPCTPTPT